MSGRPFDAVLSGGRQRRPFDDLLEEAPIDASFVNRPGGPTLEEIDAERAAAGEKIPEWQDPRSNWDKPWDEALGSVAPGALDTVRGAAKGMLTGFGVGVDTPETRQSEQRSPYLFGGAKLGSEIAGQAAVLPAQALGGVGTGAVGGFLSGYGNSQGSTLDRLRGGMEGSLLGAGAGRFGEIAGAGAGKLSSLLGRKAPEYAEKQAVQGLLNRGVPDTGLPRVDAELGGVQQAYDDANRLGIRGKPAAAAEAAKRVAQEQEAARAGIEARHANVQVDPVAAGAAVRGANPYQGVPRMDRAADRAAQGVQQAGPGLGPMDLQRKYYGDSTNFASGSPNQVLGKRVHGAINNEMEDAINLAEPGAGSQWRQAGRDEHAAITLGDMAQKTAYKQAAAPWTLPEMASGGTLRVLNNNRHAIGEGVYGAMAGGANMGQGALSALTKAPNIGGAVGGSMGATEPVKLDQVALDILHSPSQGAELGPYKSQFAEAYGGGPGALNALITRLIQTDPQFRTSLLPLLRQQGAR